MREQHALTDELRRTARAAVEALRQAGLTAATAESCTGGLIAKELTDVPGASEVFGYGFVTYAEAAKQTLLGVPEELIKRYTVISGPVAIAMARGAAAKSGADLAVAVTGLAGPGGALPGKPVGTVYLAAADARGRKTYLLRLALGGSRAEVRARTALCALDALRRLALAMPLPDALEFAADNLYEEMDL